FTFSEVMLGCAAPRADQAGTGITDEMLRAYEAMHRAGYAHSVETWIDGRHAGGLYGVSIGRAFFGEAMFSGATDASKLAVAHLARQLERWQFGLIDCQMATSHLASLGAREISRGDFVRALSELVNYPTRTGAWRFDDDLFD